MMDDDLDPRLREAAAGYNEPPEPHRDAMWAAIQAARLKARREHPAPRARSPWKTVAWAGLAAAAVLAVGIFIGKGLGRPGDTPSAPIAAGSRVDTTRGDRAFKVAAVQYLTQTEVFLTTFRGDLRQGSVDPTAGRRASELLSANRLLMDSPAAQDPKVKSLLEDLELVLAEIAQLSDQNARTEAPLIDEGLEQGGLLARLRTAVPAGQTGL